MIGLLFSTLPDPATLSLRQVRPRISYRLPTDRGGQLQQRASRFVQVQLLDRAQALRVQAANAQSLQIIRTMMVCWRGEEERALNWSSALDKHKNQNPFRLNLLLTLFTACAWNCRRRSIRFILAVQFDLVVVQIKTRWLFIRNVHSRCSFEMFHSKCSIRKSKQK